MKKVILSLAIIGFIATVSSSCKKDYTCECTVSGVTHSTTIENVTKSDADKDCTDMETSYKTVDPSATCTLK